MKACLFDIDGTLVLTGGAGQVAFAETFAAEFGVEQMTTDISFAGRSDRAIALDLLSAHGIEPSDANWRQFRDSYLPRLDAALERCDGEVLPGVVEVIDQLHRRGDVLVGLLTGNVEQAAEKKLGYYNLWSHFAFGGFGDHHTDRNDIAAVALAAARKQYRGNGAAAGEETIVVIGDTPNDIKCARSIGARAVAVPTGHTPAEVLAPHEPDLLISDLRDAQALLAWFDD